MSTATTSPVARTDAPVVLSSTSVFYGEVVGLSYVDLTLEPGITGIVGPNGSGKTTLMRVLTGLLEPQEGFASVFGESPFISEAVRRRIGFVPATECFFEKPRSLERHRPELYAELRRFYRRDPAALARGEPERLEEG